MGFSFYGIIPFFFGQFRAEDSKIIKRCFDLMFNVVSFETSASGVKFPGTNPTAWLSASVESREFFLFLFSSQLFSVMPLLLAVGMKNEGLVGWFWSRGRAFLLWSSLDYNPMTPLCSPAPWAFTFFKLSHNPPR